MDSVLYLGRMYNVYMYTYQEKVWGGRTVRKLITQCAMKMICICVFTHRQLDLNVYLHSNQSLQLSVLVNIDS